MKVVASLVDTALDAEGNIRSPQVVEKAVQIYRGLRADFAVNPNLVQNPVKWRALNLSAAFVHLLDKAAGPATKEWLRVWLQQPPPSSRPSRPIRSGAEALLPKVRLSEIVHRCSESLPATVCPKSLLLYETWKALCEWHEDGPALKQDLYSLVGCTKCFWQTRGLQKTLVAVRLQEFGERLGNACPCCCHDRGSYSSPELSKPTALMLMMPGVLPSTSEIAPSMIFAPFGG